jgi:UDP-N-acetylmuramyl pentapeptide phosphotransferase/UDP-N-acetylglucosamine-1-phosphate transferase
VLEITFNIWGIFVLFFIGTFLLTYIIIPIIIDVAKYNNYVDNPNGRSSHKNVTPTLGGLSFFVALIIAFFFLDKWNSSNLTIHIIPGLTILFLTGLKDDIVVLSPASKLSAQIIATVFLLSNPEMHMLGFNGFLGIETIPYYLMYPISAFIILTIINAFNLIDGIDGLASTIGSIISLVYAAIFYYLELYYLAILSIVTLAMLLAFLRFNLSFKKKIFMGDTGSLITGFMISIFTIRFLALSPEKLENLPFHLDNIPFIAMAVLIVPLFDLARVFTIRIFNKKNPFKPDRKHAHHILIDLGLSHKKTTLLMGVFNLLFIGLFVVLGTNFSNVTLIVIFISIVLVMLYILYRLDFSFSNLKKRILRKKKVADIKSKLFSTKKTTLKTKPE